MKSPNVRIVTGSVRMIMKGFTIVVIITSTAAITIDHAGDSMLTPGMRYEVMSTANAFTNNLSTKFIIEQRTEFQFVYFCEARGGISPQRIFPCVLKIPFCVQVSGLNLTFMRATFKDLNSAAIKFDYICRH